MKKTINVRTNPLFTNSLSDRMAYTNPYRELKLTDIDIDPNQPRRLFDEESIKNLAETIKQYGVMNPITVRAVEGGGYRIIAGERRYRASILAGKQTIPVVIVKDAETDIKTRVSKQLIENIQREELNPLERAEAIGKLRDSTGLSIRDIASSIGLSKTMVQRSLDILELYSDLKKALEEGKSESKVLLLAKVEDENIRKKFLDNIDNWTRADLESKLDLINNSNELASDNKKQKKTSKSLKAISQDDSRVIEILQKELGTKIEIARKQNNNEQGKLTVYFYSDENLKGIYDRIIK